VNRLSKHVSWDSVNSDTSRWCLQNRKGAASSAQALENEALQPPSSSDPLPIPAEFVFKPGDLFTFPMRIDEENLLPFGMGVVISHSKGKNIDFQWLSNYNQNVSAKFEPAWFQPSKAKHYYRRKPEHISHPKYTGKDLGVKVKAEDCILTSTDKPFLVDGKLAAWAKAHIYRNVDVLQSLEDAALEKASA